MTTLNEETKQAFKIAIEHDCVPNLRGRWGGFESPSDTVWIDCGRLMFIVECKPQGSYVITFIPTDPNAFNVIDQESIAKCQTLCLAFESVGFRQFTRKKPTLR